jgi:chromosome condensin MukBEF ATPase and DNA-binding subunit MukB
MNWLDYRSTLPDDADFESSSTQNSVEQQADLQLKLSNLLVHFGRNDLKMKMRASMMKRAEKARRVAELKEMTQKLELEERNLRKELEEKQNLFYDLRQQNAEKGIDLLGTMCHINNKFMRILNTIKKDDPNASVTIEALSQIAHALDEGSMVGDLTTDLACNISDLENRKQGLEENINSLITQKASFTTNIQVLRVEWGCGMWDVECGMRNVGCGMWDVGCGIHVM